MKSLSKDLSVVSLSEAKSALTALVSEALAQEIYFPESASTVRIEISIPHLDPLDWLAVQKGVPKIYWSGRDEEIEIAALGAADSVSLDGSVDFKWLLARLRHQMSTEAPSLRYYGGMRFDSIDSETSVGSTSSMWQHYPSARFVLPRFEVTRESGRSRLVCNLCPAEDSDDSDSILADIGNLTFDCHSPAEAVPDITARSDVPDRAAWSQAMAQLQSSFDVSRLDKVVLARRTTLEFADNLPTCALLHHLKQHAQGCYRFCFAPTNETSFIGASPERLYRRDGSRILTEALAGTCARGIDPEHDRQLAEQLKQSAKEASEHQFVIKGINNELKSLTEILRYDERAFLARLNRLQHLKVRFEGQLLPDVNDSDLLGALHPTPAVAGYPKRSALKFIQKNEPLDRGWYAGPIGWVGVDSAEFAVAIRSGLISGNRAHLFSGAGIVAESDVSEEWQEIESKITTMLGALTND